MIDMRIDDMVNNVIEETGIDIFENTRKRKYVEIRSIVIHIMYNFLGIKLFGIRDYFASRGMKIHHATILHSLNNFHQYLRYNKELELLYFTLLDKEEDVFTAKKLIEYRLSVMTEESVIRVSKFVKDLYAQEMLEFKLLRHRERKVQDVEK